MTHISRIDARGVGAKFHSYPSSLTTQTVKSVVGNFGAKCGERDVKNASVFGRRSVAMAWSAHTLLLLAAIGIVLVCVGVLSWLAFRKSELVG